MKNLLALLLCLIILAGCFTACGGKGDPKKDPKGTATVENTAGNETDSASTTTENLYDENGFLKDHLPEADFGNTEFNVLAYWKPYTEYDIKPVDIKDSVDAAIYKRDREVEDRYNIAFNFISIYGDYENRINYISRVENMASTGESFDMISMYSLISMNLASKGLLANLLDNEMSALDFSNPWWSYSLVEYNTIGGKLFYATGDISVSYVKQMEIMLYNYDLAKNWSIATDPIDDVKNDEWTLERMLDYTKNVYQDLDHDLKKSSGDVFGFVSTDQPYFDFFSAGFSLDTQYMEINEAGSLTIGSMFTANGKEKATSVVNRMVNLFNNTDEWVGADVEKDGIKDKSLANTVKSGNALFTVLVTSEIVSGGYTYDYGVLPCPKYDANQKDYYAITSFPTCIYAIVKQVANPTKSAIIMEALASQSYRRVVTPLFEEQVKTRYANNERNREMFDLIRSRITICPTRLLCQEMHEYSGASLNFGFRRKIVNNMDNFASNLDVLEIQVDSYLKEILMPAFQNQ